MNLTNQPELQSCHVGHVYLAYRYRCHTGTDQQSKVILPNQHALTLRQLKALLRVLFYDGIYFDADLCGVPSLTTLPNPDWHEITQLRFTQQPCSVPLDITDFLANALKNQRPRSFPDNRILDSRIVY